MRQCMMVIMFLSILTGCSIAKSPFDLLTPTNLDNNQRTQLQVISQYLPANAKLVLPSRSKQMSAIQQVDLDGDHQKEMVIFYTEENNPVFISILVLQKKGIKWTRLANLEESRSSIDYIDFQDITGDQRPEIIVGMDGYHPSQKTLSIYLFKNNHISELTELTYTDIAIRDLNHDHQAELVLVQLDTYTTEVKVYQYRNQKIDYLDSFVTEDVDGILQVLIGSVNQTQTGIFVDTIIGGNYPLYYTNLLILEKGKLKLLFTSNSSEHHRSMLNEKAIKSEDVNHDGIIDIGVLTEPPSSITDPWLLSWYNWNKKNQLQMVNQSDRDLEAGFQFNFPLRWQEKIILTKKNSEETGFTQYSFFSQNYEQFPLLSIHYFPIEEWEAEEKKLKKSRTNYLLLKREGNRVYIATFPSIKTKSLSFPLHQIETMKLTKSEVKKGFQIIHPFSFRNQRKQIQFNIQATEETLVIKGDPNRMKQVMINLLDNAIKFTPSGGKINIISTKLDQKAQLEIVDTGMGIAPGELKKVTEKFYKGRSKQSGSGLGLSICKEIIQLHQGTMQIESEVGKGTKIIIQIPCL